MIHRVLLSLGLLAALLSTVRAEEKICPAINLTIAGPPGPVCVGAPLTIVASDNEIAGNYNGMTTFPGKEWTWEVSGVKADPAQGVGSSAVFTPRSGGDGAIHFHLACTSSPGAEDCDGAFAADGSFHVVEAKLGVDCNRNGKYDDEDRLLEEGDGWFVGVNQDDDNTNCAPDWMEAGIVADENDLIPIFLNPDPALKSGSLTLEAVSGGDKIQIWKTAERGEPVPLPMTWYPGHGTIPPVRYVEGTNASDNLKDVQLRLTYRLDSGEHSATSFLTVIKVDLVPDWNHDRVIDENDRGQATVLNPYRFWINDDKDDGDVASDNSDLPGQSDDNASDDRVNGRCDLLDFFPIWLDIGNVVEILPRAGNSVFVLRQANDAVNFFQSDLSRQEAGHYLIGESQAYGWGPCVPAHQAVVANVPRTGISITDSGPEIIRRIETDKEKGVLVLEGRKVTAAPLVLEIHMGGAGGALIYEMKLPLRIDGVENMYRWINLRPVAGDSRGQPSRPGDPPNNPDSQCNNKHIVFIHGFNESPDDGLANVTETFKRLYWSGSRAKFTGVTWYGDQNLSTFYHANVTNAFLTSPAFAQYLSMLQGDVNVMAFSLGNMVVSSAIKDHGANPTNYFMLHAAVAREAYDSAVFDPEMVQVEWRGYSNGLWASKWYELFLPGDGRTALTWNSRFCSTGPRVYNFYSRGEEVLETLDGPPGVGDLGGLVTGTRQYSWCIQEQWKGRHWVDWIGGSTYGGWGFNSSYDELDLSGDPIHRPPDRAAELLQPPYSILKEQPFFNPGGAEVAPLYGADYGPGSDFATNNLNMFLAEMIPALSLPVGANPVSAFVGPGGDRNFNMNTPAFQNGWPEDRLNGDWQNRWLHGDYKAVAYFYVFGLFDKIRDLGGLNQ